MSYGQRDLKAPDWYLSQARDAQVAAKTSQDGRTEPLTVADVVARGDDGHYGVAVLGRAPLSRAALQQRFLVVARVMAAASMGPRDKVMIVSPHASEMGLAVVGVATGAMVAPLKPDYRRTELDFYPWDLDTSLLVVVAEGEYERSALDAARALGTHVLRPCAAIVERAGIFDLETGAR